MNSLQFLPPQPLKKGHVTYNSAHYKMRKNWPTVIKIYIYDTPMEVFPISYFEIPIFNNCNIIVKQNGKLKSILMPLKAES